MTRARHVFDPPLLPGRLVRRYKRFFADVVLDDGREVIAHCANTGRMQGLLEEGSRVWLKHHDDPKRKLAWSWEIASTPGEVLVGINTHLPNALVSEAIVAGQIPTLAGYESLRREVPYGERSRVDILLEGHPEDPRPCYVEVKNVTLVDGDLAIFPDAVTTRGLKHLNELSAMVKEGARALMFYLVQREDGRAFGPADAIDPAYGRGLREALAQGVEALAWTCKISPVAIEVVEQIPVEIEDLP